MFCSTIIPTINRSTLTRAVQSVVDQDWPEDDFEIIIVNDSGAPLADAPWQQLPFVRIVTTQRRERSVARNAGAAEARAEFLHFLDDDDWLLPNAYASIWRLTDRVAADWYYGATQLVDRSGAPLLQLHHGLQGNCFTQVMAGEWIPLQSSFIRASTFARSGGFNPAISGPEDVDLCRRILLRGDLAETDALIAAVGMGEAGSTTDRANHAGASRLAREQILEQPGVLSRLFASAASAPWRGRIVRIYLTSALWNLQRSRLLHGGRRGLYGLAALLGSARFWRVGSFWENVLHRYESATFAQGRAATNAARPQDAPAPSARLDRGIDGIG